VAGNPGLLTVDRKESVWVIIRADLFDYFSEGDGRTNSYSYICV
jgi:hypothetical protein